MARRIALDMSLQFFDASLWQSAEFQNKTALQKQKGGNLYSATRSGGGSVPSTRVLF